MFAELAQIPPIEENIESDFCAAKTDFALLRFLTKSVVDLASGRSEVVLHLGAVQDGEDVDDLVLGQFD